MIALLLLTLSTSSPASKEPATPPPCPAEILLHKVENPHVPTTAPDLDLESLGSKNDLKVTSVRDPDRQPEAGQMMVVVSSSFVSVRREGKSSQQDFVLPWYGVAANYSILSAGAVLAVSTAPVWIPVSLGVGMGLGAYTLLVEGDWQEALVATGAPLVVVPAIAFFTSMALLKRLEVGRDASVRRAFEQALAEVGATGAPCAEGQ